MQIKFPYRMLRAVDFFGNLDAGISEIWRFFCELLPHLFHFLAPNIFHDIKITSFTRIPYI